MQLIAKLQAIKEKWMLIQEQLSDPELIKDMKRFKQLNKEYKDMSPVVHAFDKYQLVVSNAENCKLLINTEKDAELWAMAKEELVLLEDEKEQLEEKIKLLLVPKDAEDEKNAILEIRAGTGGDEAGIFAGDLYKMYSRYFEKKGWKTEVINMNESEKGGYKEIVMEVEGQDVYGKLKYESGVHRVQRVPETESQGRVHTSAATVAVLPEAEEVDVDINMNDVKIDTFRASGAGGQHVNKTESAIRMTHIPTGIVVECQDERSQMKNKAKALKVLRTRIYEKAYNEHMAIISKHRKTLVSTGDRSAKIRTYNFPQGRVTDHRINFTMYNLPEVMNGNIDELMDALQIAENAEKMKAGGL
ncbi:MAG: peptide chain release factor 1 [Chitinophagales bacterium]|nr:peptide chain release factor 1 [Chitinophagales bacterium]